ncbi:MAG TPA: aminomethyl-transferring glycine dehydrogenase subunit GcvPB, partial [Micavibrio sp.]|nr:aminomethyl-transferring glycine dehydrogenase subunit GcvPB [Micavibrio sp.]
GDDYKLLYEDDMPETLGRLRGFVGQFGMHVRALSYMMSHGADGLKQVSEDAVLNANYLLSQLKDVFYVPYEGPCMHECLLTDKKQKEKGVETIDIAKALTEYGYHPMTVYFPLVLPGTMLIEPTETESLDALDRFVTTMKTIASDVEKGDTEKYHNFPISTPRRRLDEVKAARQPVLRWKEAS